LHYLRRLMALLLKGTTDTEKLADLTSRNYKAQAVWFLNAFWNDFASKEAETIYTYTRKHEALDPNKADGNQLDELNAHRFLEQIQSTMTVSECRDFLRGSGVDKVKYVPLVHFLLSRYKANLHKLVTATQGDNQDEIEKAQKMLETAQEALTVSQKKAQEAATSETELKAALAELHAQEEAKKKRLMN